MNKIIVLDGYTLNADNALDFSALSDLGEVSYYDYTPENKAIERIGDSSIIIINKIRITKELLDKCPNIKYIGVIATGYDVVDIEACRNRGIVVTNIPTYGTQAVAQYTFALMLELCHHVGKHSASVSNGDWAKSRDFCYWNYPLIELAGKTLGIIGYGKIGQSVAKIAVSFGLNVLAYDLYHNDKYLIDGVNYSSLENIFMNSDFISLNCPLTPENKGIICAKNIELMKKGVYIINTARGGLVNEVETANAINNGKIAGMAVDVLSVEPPRESNPLIECKNCIVTPHIAWAAKESRTRLFNTSIANLQAFLNGNPQNKVS